MIIRPHRRILPVQDRVLLRASALVGFDFWQTGIQVPISSLKKPGVDTLPTGFSFASGRVFCGSTGTLDGWDLRGVHTNLRGSNLEGGGTIRNCLFNHIHPGFVSALRIDRAEGGAPNWVIEHNTFDGERFGSGNNAFAIDSDDVIIRYNRLRNAGSDIIALGQPTGSGHIYRNWVGHAGYGGPSGAHADLLAIYGANGEWLVEENFFDQRNPGDIEQGAQPSWPMNNAIRVTPTVGTVDVSPVFLRNVISSLSNRLDKTNGHIAQDARSTGTTPGSLFDGNWVDDSKGFGLNKGSCLGIHHSCGVPLGACVPSGPTATKWRDWRSMWTGELLIADNWP